MLLSLLQVNIEDKIKNAPDDNYQIGILIGSYLPLFILVVLAYLLYRYNKNRNKES
ncbi:MAG: hypothetical protein ACI9NI_000520 [Olleya marilimosa]|jgi:hypothetical protein|uniref:Adenylosuccinate synthetase n=1 Tax=Olleya marilimosa TaxID=272164 RepID=A0ABR8LS13_9FLAO|nr:MULTISPECIES: hypothetical protein [Olleya]MBD3863001.1 hypothetical protein [Olleya marilimosa]MBD3890499.1 hypothetical protein [Olleya marilimosa]|tara:strand:+ start:22268 stop:22435 length:168 start_codon:yes stop_codon:yes gene_type:complete